MHEKSNADLRRIISRRTKTGEIRYFARVTANGYRLTGPAGTLEEALRDRDALLTRAAEMRQAKRAAKRAKKTQGQAPLREPQVIYLIQEGDDGPVKIGRCKTTVVVRRLGNLQIANPTELHLLGTIPGDAEVEIAIHKRFAHLRIRGEWFMDAPEIRELLAAQPRWLPLPSDEARAIQKNFETMKAIRRRVAREAAQEVPANDDNLAA